MRRVRLIAALVAVLTIAAGCAGDTERDDAGRMVLADEFYEAIVSSGEPSATMARVILDGTVPDDVEVKGLPTTPTARLGFFLTEVTALPADSSLSGIVEADDAIEPLVIPALAQASMPVPDNGTTDASEVMLELAPQIRSTLRDGSDAERSEVLAALAIVFGGSSDSGTIDAFERTLEDDMQEAIEDELSTLGPRNSTAEVDNVVTSLGRDWITPTAQIVGASYRMFCQNHPGDCDEGAFEGRVDLFQRQSLVPLFMNLPETALPAILKTPQVPDYPARDSDEEDVWTRWLLERGLSPISELYKAADRDPQE
ncbi:hypothetical protein [Nocardioides sp. NPDC006303]|uniref:hypothetical protein n=1 Tax=Nocardioides sp. NPDC006303 TaxID=3156747 RepID=UPI0033B31EED